MSEQMSRSQMVKTRWIMTVAGLAALAIGVVLGARELSFQSRAETTAAVVTHVERVMSHDADGTGTTTTFRPRFEFEVDGRTYETSPDGSSTSWNFARGSTIEVRYLPEDPMSAKPVEFWGSWLAPIVLTGMGLVGAPLCWFGIGSAIRARDEGRPSPVTVESE